MNSKIDSLEISEEQKKVYKARVEEIKKIGINNDKNAKNAEKLYNELEELANSKVNQETEQIVGNSVSNYLKNREITNNFQAKTKAWQNKIAEYEKSWSPELENVNYDNYESITNNLIKKINSDTELTDIQKERLIDMASSAVSKKLLSKK